MSKKVLIIASGKSVNQFNDYDYIENGWTVVAVNNACNATDKWHHWVHTDDYRGDRPVIKSGQIEAKGKDYLASLKKFGGHSACGYSITLCSAYYALDHFQPSVIGFLGADMNYTPDDEGNTHFYGVGYDIKKNGVPDPHRMVKKYGKGDEKYIDNIYNRFAAIAKKDGCEVVNFSNDPDTKLIYKKATPDEF